MGNRCSAIYAKRAQRVIHRRHFKTVQFFPATLNINIVSRLSFKTISHQRKSFGMQGEEKLQKLKIRLEFNLALDESLPADFAGDLIFFKFSASSRRAHLSQVISFKFPSDAKHDRNYYKQCLTMRNFSHDSGCSLTTKRK